MGSTHGLSKTTGRFLCNPSGFCACASNYDIYLSVLPVRGLVTGGVAFDDISTHACMGLPVAIFEFGGLFSCPMNNMTKQTKLGAKKILLCPKRSVVCLCSHVSCELGHLCKPDRDLNA